MKSLNRYICEKLMVNKDYNQAIEYNINRKFTEILTDVIRTVRPRLDNTVGYLLPASRKTLNRFKKINTFINDILKSENREKLNADEVIEKFQDGSAIIRCTNHGSTQLFKIFPSNDIVFIMLCGGVKATILKNDSEIRFLKFDNTDQYTCSDELLIEILQYIIKNNVTSDAPVIDKLKKLINEK